MREDIRSVSGSQLHCSPCRAWLLRAVLEVELMFAHDVF